MKRYGNLFPLISELENLHLAFRRARKGKSWQDTVHRVEEHLEKNLLRLQKMLTGKTFSTSGYREKIILEPKLRTVYRLPFYPDRIVQHALMNVVEPIWSSMFIDASFACRVGKGIHAGSLLTSRLVRQYRYCLKCDVSKFYPSVDHDVLYGIIARKIKCPDTLWLIHDIVYSVPGGKNIPIGNYTSQWMGNLYLNELDQFLKHRHKIVGYVRYCDDFCLFHDDKRFLHQMASEIKAYVGSRLKLTLSKCDLFPVSRGVDFLGYRHFRKYILIRKSTVKRVKKRLLVLPRLLESGAISMDQFRSSIAATIGWLRWANSYHLSKKLGIDELWDKSDGT